jgi:hypothetical protein
MLQRCALPKSFLYTRDGFRLLKAFLGNHRGRQPALNIVEPKTFCANGSLKRFNIEAGRQFY